MLGVQGAWGSGKSSYVNFVAEQIQATSPSVRVVRFDPWLIGESSALLSSLLGQLAKEIAAVEATITPLWRLDYWLFRRWREGLAGKVRRLGKYAAALAVPASAMAATDPSGTTLLAAVGLKGAGWLGEFLNLKISGVPELKAEIANELRKMEANCPALRFAVFVDDTDRLDPSEAVEVLRVIRHVVDFPLMVYVVCFDERVLSRQVADCLHVNDPHTYLEKVFQTTIPIPPHEPFALRRYARKLLAEKFPEEMKSALVVDNSGYRENVVMDTWGGILIETPRDVVRLVEAVTFGWRWLPPGADFLDFVWLQLVKLKAPKLYRWVQRYLTNVAAYRDGGRPSDDEETHLAEKLTKILQDIGWTSATYFSGLDSILPGVSFFAMEGKDRKVFKFAHGELTKFEQAGRLGSPSHWRNYFAFAFPTYAIADEELAGFRKEAAERADSAAAILKTLSQKAGYRRGHFVDVLLDRLGDLPPDSLSSKEKEGIAQALTATMDSIAATSEVSDDFGSNSIWPKALKLLKRTDPSQFQSLVENGQSLNWIAEILRDQGLAYGRPDASRADSERQWLTEPQLDSALVSFVERVNAMASTDVFNMPQPLDVLFCWHQLGDRVSLAAFIEQAMVDDDGFLEALDAMRGVSISASGRTFPLYREYVATFADPAVARNRLEQIAQTSNAKGDRAKELLAAWRERRF